MPESYSRIVIHSIWSTKYRTPWLDKSIDNELHAMVTSIFDKQGCIVYAIGNEDDHIHVLHSLPRTKTVAQILQAVKAVSSQWLRAHDERFAEFRWQTGYGSFSADYCKMDRLVDYVTNQRDIHMRRRRTAQAADMEGSDFEREYTEMLEAYGYPDFDREHVFPKPEQSRLAV